MQVLLYPRERIDMKCEELSAQHYVLFSIDSPEDTGHFFQLAKTAFPLDPPISGRIHWDAFADSLWGGLDACAAGKIALIVRDATRVRAKSEQDFQAIVDILRSAAAVVELEKQREGDVEAEIHVIVGISGTSS